MALMDGPSRKRGNGRGVRRAKSTSARRQVETVSLDLFGRRGYDTVSLKQIADIVGIHKSSIFHYYRRKQDLAAAVVRGAMGRLRDTVLPLDDEDVTLDKGLGVLDDVVDLFADRPEDARMVLTYLCAPDDSALKSEPATRPSHPGRQVYDILVKAFERGRERGLIQDIDAPQMIYSLAGLVLLYPTMEGTAEQRLVSDLDPASPEARVIRKATLRHLLRSALEPKPATPTRDRGAGSGDGSGNGDGGDPSA